MDEQGSLGPGEPGPASGSPSSDGDGRGGPSVEYDAPPPWAPPPGYGYAPPPGYPGAAIHAPTYAAPAPQRSAAASALGTLGIIFGALIALGGGLQIGCRALFQGLQAPGARDAQVTKLLQLEMGIWGLMALMSVALIVIGVGVWRHREIARKAMVIWSALALVIVFGRMATEAFVIQPETVKAQRQIFERQGQTNNEQQEQMIRAGRTIGLGLTFIVWAPYPIVALILLTRPKVRDRCS